MRYPLLSTLLLIPCLQAQPLEIRFTRPPEMKATQESGQFMGDASNFPSSNWESQAQPLGNGRLGAMVFGNPLKERIQFNDSSLWTGGSNPSGGYDVNEFGAFQNFGDLFIEMRESTGAASGEAIPGLENFSRTLDLASATHLTTWKRDGVTFSREVFVSKPAEALVIRITADKPGSVAGVIRLAGAHGEKTVVEKQGLSIAAKLSNGLRKAARIEVLAEQGLVQADGDGVSFSGNAATLILTASTDYALDPGKNFRNGIDPAETVASQALKAGAQTYDKLRTSHIEDFTKLMGRVQLDVGVAPEGKSVAERLEAYKKGAPDPHLEGLMFHYGRYLLISSSRGFLPANLQGLWNDKNKPAWYSRWMETSASPPVFARHCSSPTPGKSPSCPQCRPRGRTAASRASKRVADSKWMPLGKTMPSPARESIPC